MEDLEQAPSQDQIAELVGLYGAGQLENAESMVNDLLRSFPGAAILHNILGAVLAGQQKNRQAVASHECAIRIQPNYAQAHNNLGIVFRAQGKFDDAVASFDRAIALEPDYAEAHNNLGALLHGHGKFDAAVDCYRRAIELAPENSQAYNNLGASLQEQGKLDEAIASYLQSAKLDHQNADPHSNLGIALAKQGKFEAAVASYERAIELRPDFAEAHYNFASVLRRQHKVDEAAAQYERVVDLQPDNVDAHYNLGGVRYWQRKYDEAIVHYERVIALAPNHPEATHWLAALTGKTTLTAPDEYTEKMFDDFASTFDDMLGNKLDYKVPDLLLKMIRRQSGEEVRFSRGLDLGCGTGLSGLAMTKIVEDLDGVDLSGAMLEQAEAKKIYGKLIKGNIVDVMSSLRTEYDIVVATDVLVYVGDLVVFFKKAADMLRPNGILCFSVELLEGGTYKLLLSGRYAHSSKYIDGLCAEIGFREICSENITVRTEDDMPLAGKIFMLEKS